MQSKQISNLSKSYYRYKKQSLPQKLNRFHGHTSRSQLKTNLHEQAQRSKTLGTDEMMGSISGRTSRMPSIRTVREEKRKVAEMLSEAICQYNFKQASQQRKKKLYLLKTRKYEKIKTIRQNHLHECEQNEKRRTIRQEQIFAEKLHWKQAVDKDKQLASQAIKKSILEKKQLAQKIRKSKFCLNQERKSQKNLSLSLNRKRNSFIRDSQEKIRDQKQKLKQKYREFALKNYVNKFNKEVSQVQEIQKLRQQTIHRLQKDRDRMTKSSSSYSQKIRQVQSLLRERVRLVNKKYELTDNSTATQLTINKN